MHSENRIFHALDWKFIPSPILGSQADIHTINFLQFPDRAGALKFKSVSGKTVR